MRDVQCQFVDTLHSLVGIGAQQQHTPLLICTGQITLPRNVVPGSLPPEVLKD